MVGVSAGSSTMALMPWNHDRAHAAASGVPGGPAFGIGETDGGIAHAHFTGRADGHETGAFAVFLAQPGHTGIVGKHGKFVALLDGHAAGLDDDFVQMVVAALAFNDDGGVVQTGHVLAAGASGVGFLDAAGERALQPTEMRPEEPAVVAQSMPGAKTSVFGTQGMTGGASLQTTAVWSGAAREPRIRPDVLLILGRPRAHINA